jgi:type I restriction enzyme, S subunit
MAGEWVDCSVSDIAAPTKNSLVGGPFGSNLVSSDYVPTGIPVIRGQNVSGGRWVQGDFVFVSLAKAKALSPNTARPGDLVFTQRGTLGQVSVVPEHPFDRYIISQSQMKLAVDSKKADPLFVYYLFNTQEQQEHIRQNAIQTGVPHTNLGILRNTPIRLPPLSEQRAIARILGTLDDKIELNRRMNATLEEMARALFKSWFVDFDPVRAKAEGRDTGLPRAIADLFPDEFEDAELGEVPAAWKVGMVEDMAEVSSGKRPGVRYAEISPQTSVPLWGGNGPMAFVSSPLIDYPILLTGRVGTLGSVFRITSPCWPSDNTLILKARNPRAFEYLFLQLRRIDFSSLNRGSTQPLLTQTDLKKQPVLLPPTMILMHYSVVAKGLYNRIDASNSESSTLAALRDALLPKLISGEVRVGDAARFVGAAT